MNCFRRLLSLWGGWEASRELQGKLELDHLIWTIERRNLDRTEIREVANYV